MKYCLLIAGVLLATNLRAQNNPPGPDSGFAVIKGHVKNNIDTSLNYNDCGYLGTPMNSVAIDRNGNFLQRIRVETTLQDIVLHIGQGISLFMQAGDTIEINWDAKDVDGSIVVESPQVVANAELKTQLFLYKRFRGQLYDLSQSLSRDKSPDSVKFKRVNDLYNEEIEALLSRGVTMHAGKMVMDIYYDFASVLLARKLLSGRDLFLTHPSDKSALVGFFSQNTFGYAGLYQQESEEAFKTSYLYRAFIYEYVSTYVPFGSWTVLGDEQETKAKTVPFAPAWDNYYNGLRSFHIREMRDWFITKSIIQGLQYYSFDDEYSVYQDFITKAPSPYYLDALRTFYASVSKLRPGTPAPAFVLKDENGRLVALSDFKGKLVYIDFWGVHCGPCISDIKKFVPALHKKYKDKNIVFISICVDSDEKGWKESLKELNLEGVNLLAEGRTKGPVSKAYDIDGIPHYYIIGAAGEIVDNSAPSPWQDGLFPILDKLLNQ